MDFTLFIATIGCVTGIIALLIQALQHLESFPSLKIELDKSKHSFFFAYDGFSNNKVKNILVDTKFSAVLNLKISNKSSYPITIDEAYLYKRTKNLSKKYYQEDHDSKIIFEFGRFDIDRKNAFDISTSPILNLPYRLEAYDTLYACVNLTFADRFIQEDRGKQLLKGKLVLLTPRRPFGCQVALSECRSHLVSLLDSQE